MKQYEFKATNLIAATFEEKGIKFTVCSANGQEEILAAISIDNGPPAVVKFISRDNDNDVAVRIFGLVGSVSTDKRARVMEACNILNSKYRYLKFSMERDGDVNVEYDIPVKTADESIGEVAAEVFIRTMMILDEGYTLLAKALYTDSALAEHETGNIHTVIETMLGEMRRSSGDIEAEDKDKHEQVDEDSFDVIEL